MTLLTTPPTSFDDPDHPYLENELVLARERIQVTPEELDEAKARRQRIADALVREFGGRPYVNGSVAHGDALNPLTDVDQGIVIPDEDRLYGPGGRGPAELQQRAAAAIRAELGDDFPNLRIAWKARRRSVFVQFGDPVTKSQKDFTADVITAIEIPTGIGLYIPDYDGWDQSAPEAHTKMIADRNRQTRAAFARVMRLLKHWNRRHGHPLCSWNIKALGLGVIFDEIGMFAALRAWFDYALTELKVGPTKDPAGVAPEPVAIPDGWDLRDVLTEMQAAARGLQRAARFEDEGYPALALDELSKVFRDPEMLPGPDLKSLQDEIRRHPTVGAPLPGALPATVPAAAPAFERRAWGTR